MTDKRERLARFDNDKLIDVVKNYKQYGYDEELRETAVTILLERGITREELKVTGSFENEKFNYAHDLFNSFLKNSRIAFLTYLILFVSRVATPLIPYESTAITTAFLIVTILGFILYFVFLIMSFMNQNQFYKELGQEYGTEGALLYLFLGMPFYMFMYFYFRNQMKEKMREIK